MLHIPCWNSLIKQKFKDLSGNIQWAEVTNDGSKETLRLFVRDLIGVKGDYDKILNERAPK